VDTVDKKQMLLKQFNVVQKQNEAILSSKGNTFIKTNVKPLMDKFQEKIPKQLQKTLNLAFLKGFQFVFEKGNTFIEKTYAKDKIQLEHDLNNYAIEKYSSKKHMKNMDKQSNQANAFNQSIAFVEGGVLGLLGIGLPDIPLFIAVIMKTVNEIALTYGYNYDSEEEKVFLLYLICGAMTKEEIQRNYDEKIDSLGQSLDSFEPCNTDLEKTMKETASVLSDTLLTTKFIQGLPIVGFIGGVINPTIINKIGRYAKIKYKKRYLYKKINTFEQQ
jgi:hypothetical protein